MMILGLDIGGANLKAATPAGQGVSRPFAIWKHPEQLALELRVLVSQFGAIDGFAVTMTAELADCYPTKADGVSNIVAAVNEVAGSRPVQVWLTSGGFATSEDAVRSPLAAAASNWHALATWVGSRVGQSPAVLIDIGTTTTDLIPIDAGCQSARGRTDVTRLLAGELVYTGVRRTPVCAVARHVPFLGKNCPLAAELFATMLDVYLWLGDVVEDPTDTETANGRPATRDAAHDRLARQLCGDRLEIDVAAVTEIAEYLASQQAQQISDSLDLVIINREPRQTAIISGSGSFLASRIARRHPMLSGIAKWVDLSEELGGAVAEAACAYAVAVLASQ